jgi:epidermal growth factor receptor substrate 15
MSNKLSKVPTVLPPGLLESARVTPASAPIQAQTTGLAPQFTGPAAHPIRPQTTGASIARQSSMSISPNATGSQASGIQGWDISAQEKATADTYFARLDPQNKGLIDGEAAVPFFSESGLSQPVLAQIW